MNSINNTFDMDKIGIGIDIGGTEIKAASFDLVSGKMMSKENIYVHGACSGAAERKLLLTEESVCVHSLPRPSVSLH